MLGTLSKRFIDNDNLVQPVTSDARQSSIASGARAKQALREFWRQLKVEFRHPVTRRRWIDIALLSLVVTAILAGFRPVILVIVRSVLDAIPQGNHWQVLFGAWALFALCAVAIASGGSFSPRQFKTALRYPPYYVAVVFPLIWFIVTDLAEQSFVLDGVLSWGIAITLWAALPLAAHAYLWAISPVVLQRSSPSKPGGPTKSAAESLQLFAESPEEWLIPWLERELPVTHPDEDLFDSRRTARHIAEFVFRRKMPTIALTAGWGGGKSTTVNLTTHYLQKSDAFRTEMELRWSGDAACPEVACCVVRGWGLRDEHCVTVILREVVASLATRLDCLAISALPQVYVDAMKGARPTWLHLAVSLTTAVEPSQQLKRLDESLAAANLRLVVFIEDLDRADLPIRGNSAATNTLGRAALADVYAMLDRFHADLDQVTFVLCLSDQLGDIDFDRLCDEHFEIDPLQSDLIWDVVKAFRGSAEKVAEDAHDVDPVPEDVHEVLWGESRLSRALLRSVSVVQPLDDICNLLQYPRALKKALRRCWRAWQSLHGEVDFDDLLVVSVLRTAPGELFRYIDDYYEQLAGHPRRRRQPVLGSRDETKVGIGDEWDSKLESIPIELRQSARRLIAFLFDIDGESGAHVRNVHRPQAFHDEIYWKRIKEERVDSVITDQWVLGAVSARLQEKDLTKLIDGLFRSREFCETFERLLETNLIPSLSLTTGDYRALSTTLFSKALVEFEANASGDSFPGFIPLWRLMRRRFDATGYPAWLKDEVLAAMDHSLQFANDLEYYWGATSDPQLLTPDESADLRAAMIATVEQNYTAEKLSRVISNSHPYALHHLVVHAYGDKRSGDEASQFDASKWDWFADRLVDAVQFHSTALLPSVCILLSREIEQRDVTDRRRRVTRWKLDMDRFESLFPSREIQKTMLSALVRASGPFTDLPEGMSLRVTEVLDDAKRELEALSDAEP